MIAPRTQRGFSLIELAVVLVIIGLLVGGGIAAISATTEQTRRSEQKRLFNDVREALYGFAMANGRLPCPDTDADGEADGEEDDPGGPCVQTEGRLPWATLGVGRRDAWGAPMLYRVDGLFAGTASSGSAAFDLNDDPPDELTVSDGNDDIVKDAPAVVVSFGPQGNQVWTSSGFVCPSTAEGFSTDEIENCNDDELFMDPGYRTADSPDERFDDMLMWIPSSVLKSRMVQAGKLP